MNNPSLQDILAQVEVKNAEAKALMDELAVAKREAAASVEKITSLEARVTALIGVKPVEEGNQTLRATIFKLLSNANEPLTVREVATMVKEQGFESGSKHFANMVQQVLYGDEFKRFTRANTRPIRYTVR